MLQRGRKSSANLTVLPTATPRHHIAAPDNLSATERRTFEQVLLNAAPNYFTKNDTPLLAAYVQALGLMQHYAKKAHDDPAIQHGCQDGSAVGDKIKTRPERPHVAKCRRHHCGKARTSFCLRPDGNGRRC